MHAAHLVPVERLEKARSDAPAVRDVARRGSERGRTWVCLTVLLLACSLALIDSLTANVVAFERDTSDFYYPLMAWVGQQLHQGVFPLWSPQVFGGYPIFADGEIGLAYPPVLLALLTLPSDRALIVLRLAHLFLASMGCFALARAWGLTHAAATLAGLTFALGSFLQAMAHHENIVRTAAWLPVILALVERALRRDGLARRRWTAAAALALGLAGLGLHSQVLAMELLTLAGYGVFRWSVGPIRGARGRLGRPKAVVAVCGPVVLLGLGLAAVQLVPLIELASFSRRGSGIPYAEAAAYSLTPLGVIQLVLPFFFRGEANQQWGLWTHWESYLYVGLAPLVLASVALVCIRRREVVGWGVMGLVGGLLALGQYSALNLHYWLWLLPGMSGLRAPGRFTLIVVLAAAMLAAHGLSWLQRGRGRRGPRRLLVGACVLPGVLGGLLVTWHALLVAFPAPAAGLINGVYLSRPHDVLPLTTSDVYDGLLWSTDLIHNLRTLGALVGFLLVGLALLAWHSRFARRLAGAPAWPGLLVAMTLIDLVIFSWSIHPRAQLAALANAPAAVQALAGAGDGQPFRVLASPVLTQVASDRLAPLGLQDANGYSSLESNWHTDYLRRALRTDDQVLDLWNVRYLIDPAHFGALPSYHDVRFLPGQPMLQATAGSPNGDQTFRLEAPTSASEVRLVLALLDAVELPQGAQVGQVIVRGPEGQVVGQHSLQAGLDVMDWGWDTPNEEPYIRHARVEVAGIAREPGPPPNQRLLSFTRFEVPAGASVQSVEVRAAPAHGELALYGLAVMDASGRAQQLFGRHNAKYTQVYRDDDIAIVQDSAAFPRAFVVPSARIASAGSQLDEMIHGPFDPRAEVVLNQDEAPADLLARLAPASGEPPDGPAASARVDEYTPNRVRVAASTPRDALLVLSDSVYPGWRAFVDGRETPVLRGDMLFRVVPLPAGQHEVEFRFEPRSVQLGLLVTLASLLLLIGLVVPRARTR